VNLYLIHGALDQRESASLSHGMKEDKRLFFFTKKISTSIRSLALGQLHDVKVTLILFGRNDIRPYRLTSQHHKSIFMPVYAETKLSKYGVWDKVSEGCTLIFLQIPEFP